jgi:hypothetical protein
VPDAAASTASRPASVAIAIRPSVGRDGEGYRFDLGRARTEIFLKTGLDSRIARRANQPTSADGRVWLNADDNVMMELAGIGIVGATFS